MEKHRLEKLGVQIPEEDQKSGVMIYGIEAQYLIGLDDKKQKVF